MKVGEQFELDVLNAAVNEVVDQADWYVDASGDELADRCSAAVAATFNSLTTMQERGAPCWMLRQPLNALRCIPVEGFDRFLVYYRVRREDQVVTVVAVLHEARNAVQILSARKM